MAAMQLHGVRRDDGAGTGAGVKVKFIETQFVTSDAASFKTVVQRLTGKSAQMPPLPAAAAAAAPMHRPHRRLCRGVAGEQGSRPYCVYGGDMTVAQKQAAAAYDTPRLEELNELCDFADLLYATAGARRDGGSINDFRY